VFLWVGDTEFLSLDRVREFGVLDLSDIRLRSTPVLSLKVYIVRGVCGYTVLMSHTDMGELSLYKRSSKVGWGLIAVSIRPSLVSKNMIAAYSC